MVEIKRGEDLLPGDEILISQPVHGRYTASAVNDRTLHATSFAARIVRPPILDISLYSDTLEFTARVVDKGQNLPVEVGAEFTVRIDSKKQVCVAHNNWRHRSWEEAVKPAVKNAGLEDSVLPLGVM